ncbi:MAG: hypothetical protein ACRCXZ_10945 [Patescibacteria group bacterium]
MKKLGEGLQYEVFEFDDKRVLKKLNSNENRIQKLISWKIDEDKFEFELDRINNLTKKSTLSVIKSQLPKKIIANPEFFAELEYIQDKLIIPNNIMLKEGFDYEKLFEDYINLVYLVWSYGLHDPIMNFTINCGYNLEGEFVFCDFGEFDTTKKRAIRTLSKRRWTYCHSSTSLDAATRELLIKTFDKHLTKEKLEYYWKRNKKNPK